jgi:hypothetical protein
VSSQTTSWRNQVFELLEKLENMHKSSEEVLRRQLSLLIPKCEKTSFSQEEMIDKVVEHAKVLVEFKSNR